MLFLKFELFKPESWLSGTAPGIMGAIVSGMRTLYFQIIEIIYGLLVNVYNLFDKLCNARLLNNDILNAMSKRIGLILGIIMFFYIIFSFIQMLIDPEKVSNKESGAITVVKKVIIVIVLLGVSNTFFDLLYGVQKKIIQEDVISRLILPYTVTEETKTNFGNLLSSFMIKSFYYIDEETFKDSQDSKVSSCKYMVKTFYEQINKRNSYDYGYLCLNESVKVPRRISGSADTYDDEIYLVSFNGLIAIGVGIYIVYVLLIYCFKIGVRMIQLAFLEIISPMAIISYMSPKKDTMFAKWWKLYFATYIDVFIRIAIINFIVFLICTIFSSENYGLAIFETLDATDSEKLFFIVVIVLALLTFAKKAPDLIKELLPGSASKIGFGTSMKDIVGLEKVGKWAPKAAGGILGGAAAGAAMGLLGGGIGGFAGGLLKGGISGLKGQGLAKTASSAWKSQKSTNKRIHDWRTAGGTSTFARWGTAFDQWRGADTEADKFDKIKVELETENAAYKAFDGYLDAAEKRAEGQILKGKFSNNAHAQEALKQKNLAEIYRQQSATIKRSDYAIYDKSGNIVDYDDDRYQYDLDELADKATAADKAYLAEMKTAKSDYITYTLAINNGQTSYTGEGGTIYTISAGETADAPTLQNLQQAAGIVDANHDYGYEGFRQINGADLLSGNYGDYDTTNSRSKGQQAENNNTLAANATKGKAARANAKYSGQK